MEGNENEYEQTWLYHRGHWELVNDPIMPEEPGETYQDYLDFLGKNGFKEHWTFGEWLGGGETDFIPYHFTCKVFVNEAKSPHYLIQLGQAIASEAILATDLPDLLEVLHLITSLVTADVHKPNREA